MVWPVSVRSPDLAEARLEKSVVTLERFIIEQERGHPQATGKFTHILIDLMLAAKLIGRAVNKAGLVEILGRAGHENVHGDEVQRLDEYAQDVIFSAMDHTGHLCLMISEESGEPMRIPERFPVGPYILVFDPLDGSSNIEANISIGTIFAIYRRVTEGPPDGPRDGTLEDALQPGREMVAAGYVLYGSSTMLVYTTGQGVHGFTLDPSIGEFLLSHPDIRIPSPGKRIYSLNEGYASLWSAGQRRVARHFRAEEGGEIYTQRYVGSLVADVHRTLLYGGIFMYPSDADNPEGKLRLMYEVAPLALLCERAGGRATDGSRDILEIVPGDIHQKTPVYLGEASLVGKAGELLAGAP